jgi:hypothetical protein
MLKSSDADVKQCSSHMNIKREMFHAKWKLNHIEANWVSEEGKVLDDCRLIPYKD